MMASMVLPADALEVLTTRQVIQAMVEAENDADWARWESLVSEDVIIDHPTLGAQVGVAANLALIKAFREAVDDYRRDVFDVVCDGENGAFRFAITGVLARDIGTLRPATGRPFEVAGATFVGTRAGRLVRSVRIITTNTLRSD